MISTKTTKALSVPQDARLMLLKEVLDARLMRAQLCLLEKDPLVKSIMSGLKQDKESMLVYVHLFHKTFECEGSGISWSQRMDLKLSLTLTPRGFGWAEDWVSTPPASDGGLGTIKTSSSGSLWTKTLVKLINSGLTIEKVVEVLNNKAFASAESNSSTHGAGSCICCRLS